MTNRFTFDDALEEELGQVEVPILGEVAALEPAKEQPQTWGPEELKAAIDAVRAEKQRMAEAQAAVNKEMHRDSVMCRRLHRKPDRGLVKEFMRLGDLVGKLDGELRALDPQLPPPNWRNSQGFQGHP